MSEKINWSKLSEMPPYAPTGPGRYLMRCGGVVEIISNGGSLWVDRRGKTTKYWNELGIFCEDFQYADLVAPAPDVLPWEECDQLEGLLVHANKEYASLYEASEADRQAQLKLVEECERLRKPSFKVGDVVVDNDTARVSVIQSVDSTTDIHRYYKISHSFGTCSHHHLRHATPSERAAFFAKNPTLHPAYKPEHGDMSGWRYLESDELLEEGDNFWNYHNKSWSNFMLRVGETQFNNGHPYRRRVQAEKEVV